MNLNYDQIALKQDPDERLDYIKAQLRLMDRDDPIYLSDVISKQKNVGGDILIALSEIAAEDRMSKTNEILWTIKVLRDEWGNVPQPGDTVEWVYPINRTTRDGRPLMAEDANVAMMDGSFSDKYEGKRVYRVDKKGCIRCPLEDAVNFLNTHGIHGKTGYALPHGKPEQSTEPCKAPNGDKLHIWYWRYSEQSKEMYEKLPVVEAVSGKKRGS